MFKEETMLRSVHSINSIRFSIVSQIAQKHVTSIEGEHLEKMTRMKTIHQHGLI